MDLSQRIDVSTGSVANCLAVAGSVLCLYATAAQMSLAALSLHTDKCGSQSASTSAPMSAVSTSSVNPASCRPTPSLPEHTWKHSTYDTSSASPSTLLENTCVSSPTRTHASQLHICCQKSLVSSSAPRTQASSLTLKLSTLGVPIREPAAGWLASRESRRLTRSNSLTPRPPGRGPVWRRVHNVPTAVPSGPTTSPAVLTCR